MKININWLKEFVDFKEGANEIAKILSNLGLEAEIVDEQTLNVEVTANRGDCLSIFGLAREISAKLDLPLNSPKPEIKEISGSGKLNINFSAEAKKLIPRYTYRILKNIKIGPTPVDLVKKLESYGFRSINNVVDITNFVMIELGQPMHAFDLDKLKNKLKLRLSKEGEKIITLDGKEHILKAGILIGEDKNNKLVDLCGIMGGFYSEVDEKTRNIVLQAAIFDPINIRTTSRYLNHTTDASYRYERGVDQNLALLALNRATELILKISGGEAGRVEDLENKKIEHRIIKIDNLKINNLLGTNFSAKEMKESLEKLGFKIIESDNNFSVQVPSFRLYDIYFAVDLGEEILRLNGYDKIKPANLTKIIKKPNNYFSYKENLKDKLAKVGFSETLSYSFISRQDVPLFDLSENDLVRIKKPMSHEFEFFRPALYINVLKQVARNPWFNEVKFFEIGRVATDNFEEERIVVMSAQKDGRKELEKIAQDMGLKVSITQVLSKITQQLKIKKPVFYFEFKLDDQIDKSFSYTKLPLKKAKTPSIFPPAQIDLAFITDEKVESNEIEEFLNKQENVILAEVFDEFKSDKFGAHKKNLAYHLWLEKKDGALSENEIKQITDKIVNLVNSKFSTALRK